MVFGLAGLVLVAIWILGLWQFSFGETTIGAVLMVGGGGVAILLVAAWRRNPDAAVDGVIQAIVEYLSSR
jgi:hypothetical protein